MPRPTKQGLDYFSFDVDFFDDEKIMAISGEFGIKGEIVVIKLLCAIYRNGYFILWSDLLRFKLIKSMPGVSAELLDSIVARLVLWGFFDKSLFDSSRVLTSTGIQKRYFAAIKRRQVPTTLDFLLVDVSCCGVSVDRNKVSAYNNPASGDVSAYKNSQSKGKESKRISPGGDIRKNPPLPPPEEKKFPLEEQIALVKTMPIWQEEMAKKFYCSSADIVRLFETDFRSLCIRSGKDYPRTEREFKSHFNNWMGTQRFSSQSSQNVTTANTGQHTDPTTARQRQFAEHIISKLNAPDSPEPDVTGLY